MIINNNTKSSYFKLRRGYQGGPQSIVMSLGHRTVHCHSLSFF